MRLVKPFRFLPAMIAVISLSAGAGQGIHIDASSDAAANHSLQRMLASMDTNQKQQLTAAIVQLNQNVPAGSDARGKPVQPSAARIKDQIGGLTATEIIELAHHTPPAAAPAAK